MFSIRRSISRLMLMWLVTWGMSALGVAALTSPGFRERIKRTAEPIFKVRKKLMGHYDEDGSAIIEEDFLVREGLKERISELEDEIKELKYMMTLSDIE